MDKNIDKIIRDYLAAVAEQIPGFVKAFLFGSFAQNRQNKDSDIDIALVIDQLDDEQRFNVQVQLMVLAAQFDSRIEPHPVSKVDMDSGNPFVHEVVLHGIEIK